MAPVAPSMPLLSDDYESSNVHNESILNGWSIDTAEAEAFLSEMYGSSGQHDATSQARPPTKTTSDLNTETFEKFLMESEYLRRLSENQATIMETQMILLQNQEKVFQNQEGVESILKVILNELRYGKRSNEDKSENSPKRTNKQKRNRNSVEMNVKSNTMTEKLLNEHPSEQCIDEGEDPFVEQTKEQKRKRFSENKIETDAKIRSKKLKTEATYMPLNIEKSLYYNNCKTKTCIICKKQYERIVVHYKTCHSLSEVVASRLSPKTVKEYQKNRPKSSVVVKGTDKLVKANCAFCEEEKAFTATYWPNHIQSHTGEYRNSCQVCGLFFPYTSHHCKKRTRNMDDFRLDGEDLTVHLCLECNYVQIDKANIIQHLETQHKFNDEIIESKYTIITLLSIKNEDKTLQYQTSNKETSNHTADNAEAIAVNLCFNEPVANGEFHVIDLNSTNHSDNTQDESIKYWRIQESIKNDPLEKENLLAVAEHYKQSSTYDFQVKQWISDKWTKPTISLISQFALFKCMHPQCVFSTNTTKDMKMHMENHRALIDVLKSSAHGVLNESTRDEQIKFRDCCYCDFNANSNQKLLDHVIAEHDQSIFQCAYCFYRSVEMDNVILHYETHHPREKPEIYLCGEVKEFREQDREMLQEDVEKIQKILCAQDECSEEFGTFDDLLNHLSSEHPDNTNYQCKYCNETVPREQIESHLNTHTFYEFECIYCKSFGDNNILKLRKHLSSDHPSKFSFVATRRRLPGVELIADFNILYIGDLFAQNSYEFIKLPSGTDLSCMDPSLHAYESHQLQQNSEVVGIPFTEPLPQLTFYETSNSFFLKYDFPYLCTTHVDSTGVVCNFRTNKEDDLLRHISKKHSEKQITYKTTESVSQVEKCTKLVIYEFKCNKCHKRYKTQKDIVDHFRKMHSRNVFDSKIIQNLEIIESNDPKQPIQSKQTIYNRLQYSGLFVYSKDKKFANTKRQIIDHYRRTSSGGKEKWLEFQIKTMIYDPSYFGFNAGDLTEENEKFDRMLAYECNRCCNEHTLNRMLFGSIEEVEAHCKEMHKGKMVSYIPKILIACVECSTISTIDGMKQHYRQNHPNARFAIASPTSKQHCGACNCFLRTKKLLIKHFKNEHQTGHYEQFYDGLLRNFQIAKNHNFYLNTAMKHGLNRFNNSHIT